jgi:hypothetical protein
MTMVQVASIRREFIPNPILLPLISLEQGAPEQGKEKGEKFFRGFTRRSWYQSVID